MPEPTMKAIRIPAPGEPAVLALAEVPRPAPGASEVLVRVAGSGVNRADLLQRRGLYPAPPDAPPDIPGLEFAGRVVGCGAGATMWRAGEAVMGIVGGGGYAEYVVVHERTLVRAPTTVSLVEAAAIPEVFATAYDALYHQLRVAPYATLLVHAVGSGVGSAAVQLGRLASLVVFGTSRTAAKLERAQALGLGFGVLGAPGWEEQVLALTGGRGVDAILDLIGGATLAASLKALAPRGRLALVGLTAGRRAEVDLGLLLGKRLTLVGTALRSRPLEEKAALMRELELRVVPLFDAGQLRPVIDRVLPAREARAAHERLESNDSYGKIVLSWEE